jgi:hypothetical protein
MHFQMKSILKNNHNYTLKHASIKTHYNDLNKSPRCTDHILFILELHFNPSIFVFFYLLFGFYNTYYYCEEPISIAQIFGVFLVLFNKQTILTNLLKALLYITLLHSNHSILFFFLFQFFFIVRRK